MLDWAKRHKECVYRMGRTKDQREGITWSSPGTALLLLQLVPWRTSVVWFLQRNLQLVPRQPVWSCQLTLCCLRSAFSYHSNRWSDTFMRQYSKENQLHDWIVHTYQETWIYQELFIPIRKHDSYLSLRRKITVSRAVNTIKNLNLMTSSMCQLL